MRSYCLASAKVTHACCVSSSSFSVTLPLSWSAWSEMIIVERPFGLMNARFET